MPMPARSASAWASKAASTMEKDWEPAVYLHSSKQQIWPEYS